MGFLNWLKGSNSNVEELDDLIWISAAAKWAGVTESIAEALAASDAPMVVLVVAHFDDCLADVRNWLTANAIDDPRVFALRADDVESAKGSLLELDDSHLVEMIVAERHPLLERDDYLVEFARQCGCRFRVTHHLALDDPLLQVIAGDWVRDVLEEMGLTEDEPIQSRMVSRRMRAAQKKITRNAGNKQVVDSASSWFKQNTT